jgi:hypothetical protein
MQTTEPAHLPRQLCSAGYRVHGEAIGGLGHRFSGLGSTSRARNVDPDSDLIKSKRIPRRRASLLQALCRSGGRQAFPKVLAVDLRKRWAALSVRPSGVPSPSTTRCRFVPALLRPVGLGLVSALPFWRVPTHCRAMPGSSRGGPRRAVAPGARYAAPPRPRLRATPSAFAKTSCRCSPFRPPHPATGSRCVARTGCPPVPPGPVHTVCRPRASAVRKATSARLLPRERQEQEEMPSPLNAQSRVSSPALSAGACWRLWRTA